MSRIKRRKNAVSFWHSNKCDCASAGQAASRSGEQSELAGEQINWWENINIKILPLSYECAICVDKEFGFK